MFSGPRALIKSFPRILRLAKWARLQASRPKSRLKWRALQGAARISLELGSGPKTGRDGWTTVDVYGADITHDLRKGIPLQAGSVDQIYASHLLEHIPYPAMLGFIGECRRVLKKGGRLYICVPDAGRYIQAYVEHRQFRNPDTWHRPASIATGSFLDQVNYVAYMGGEHHYLFDQENLVNTLRAGGFDDVALRQFDPVIDAWERDFESIYAVATK